MRDTRSCVDAVRSFSPEARSALTTLQPKSPKLVTDRGALACTRCVALVRDADAHGGAARTNKARPGCVGGERAARRCERLRQGQGRQRQRLVGAGAGERRERAGAGAGSRLLRGAPWRCGARPLPAHLPQPPDDAREHAPALHARPDLHAGRRHPGACACQPTTPAARARARIYHPPGTRLPRSRSTRSRRSIGSTARR